MSVLVAGCGGGSGGGAGTPDAGLSFEPVGVTTLVPSTVAAGETVDVRCLLYDAEGNSAEVPAGETVEVSLEPASRFGTGDDARVAMTAGPATARCRLPDRGMIDDDPPSFTVVPGPIDVTEASVGSPTVTAGTPATVGCRAWDAYGNEVTTFEPTLVVDPPTAGTAVQDLEVTIKQSGSYAVVCAADGARQLDPAHLDVLPDLPASIALSVRPEREQYPVNSSVTLVAQPLDRFGNPTDGDVDYRAGTPGTFAADDAGGFQLTQEGTARLEATVAPPTYQSRPVQGAIEIEVNGNGPSIECVGPDDGAMIMAAPGSTYAFVGRVRDASGVASVEVDGQPVTVQSDGSFQANVPLRFGINFVEVVAQDTGGVENSRTCAFLASGKYVNERGFLDDALSLELRQAAVDDSNTADLDSLNDAIDRVLDSDGPIDAIEDAIIDALPDQISYQRGNLTLGPHETHLSLTNAGLRVQLSIEDIHLRADVHHWLCSGAATLDIDELAVDIDFRIDESYGEPRVSVAQVHTLEARGLDVDIGCFLGWVIDAFVDEDGVINRALRSAAPSLLDGILSSALSSIDTNVGGTFDVPRIDGGAPVGLRFATKFSSVDPSTARLLVGFATQVRSERWAQSRDSLGVAVPPGPVLLEPGSQSAGAALSVATLNQALHALWRGGWFDFSVDSADVGSLPSGTSIALRPLLPPVASIEGGKLVVRIGAAKADAVLPGLLDTSLTVGASASADISLDPATNALVFGDLTVDELVLSLPDQSISASTRAQLESTLTNVLQAALDASVNGALPTFPLPEVRLGDALAEFGLSGTLGLVDPTFRADGSHFVLTSQFGLLP